MEITTIGVDLAKNVFQVHGMDEHGKTVVRKRLSRDKFLEFFVVPLTNRCIAKRLNS